MKQKDKQRLIEMADGSYVEHDVLNIVDKIRAYDENLVLKYTPNPSISDPPYKLFEKCRDGIERKVFDIWELDERVIERLYAADNARNNVLQDLDGHNLTVQQINERRYKEEMEEAADMLTSMLKSPKGRYSMRDQKTGNVLKFDDQEGIPAQIKRT